MSGGAKRSMRGVRSSALAVLATCFIGSAAIRAGEVVAALPGKTDDGFGNAIATTDGTASTDAGALPGGAVPEVLIAELRRQREMLDARQAELDKRENTLKALEQRLEARLGEMREARDHLARTAALVTDAAAKDVARLAQMYQQMKPKQAGQIFNEMAPSFAAGFIAEMRPDAAALILANMDADKAYAVSLLIAGRNVKRQEAAAPPSN